MSSRVTMRTLSGIGTVWISLAQPVFAADPPTPAAAAPSPGTPLAVGDIVVTARRKSENVQDVPITISAFSGNQLASAGVNNAAELSRAVPGVFTAPGANRGSNTPVFAIRGQLNRDPTPTNDSSVGLYFAEVPWARNEGAGAAFVDLQSVAVLKGPQGTLFGRNTTAGAVLITPNAPDQEFAGYAKLTTGNYGMVGGEAVLNTPLAGDLALRIVGGFQDRDGYLLAVNSGQRYNNVNNHSFRGSLKWSPAGGFSTTVIGTYYRSSTAGDGARLDEVAPAPPSGAVAPIYPLLISALNRTSQLGPYDFLTSWAPGVANSMGSSQHAGVEVWSVQDNSTWQLGHSELLGELTLKNIVSYRHETDGNTFETVPVDFLAIQVYDTQGIGQITEELQLQGKRGRLEYILGGFFFRESGFNDSLQYAFRPVESLTDSRVINTSYSVFGHLNYDLSALVPGLSASAGVRLNNDRRQWDGRNRTAITPGPGATTFTCSLVPAVGPNDGSLCSNPRSVTFREPTWDLGLKYQLADQSLVYASAARGYRSGGWSQAVMSPAAAVPFKPEIVMNYELGSKNRFEFGSVAVRLNASIFYTDYSNIQRTINLVTNAGIQNLTVNAAKAKIYGTDIDLLLTPAAGLELSAAYSYVKPKYDSFVDQYRDPVSGLFYPVDVSGSEFALVSRHSINIGVSYDFPEINDLGLLRLSVSYYYRTSFYTTSEINTGNCAPAGDPNPLAFYAGCYNHAGKLPGYGLTNARLELDRVAGTRIKAALFVNNLANKYYYPNGINTLGQVGGLSHQIGAPRMFGVELSVPFGAAR